MKRFLLVFTLLMVFSFGLAQAAFDVIMENVPAQVFQNSSYTVNMRYVYTPGDGSAVTGSTNGWQIWTSNNAYTDNFTVTNHDTVPYPGGWSSLYDGGNFVLAFSMDGNDRDTVGDGGFNLFKPGLKDPFNALRYTITVAVGSAFGDTLCIDSSWYPPGGDWLWSTNQPSTITPTWNGPFCWLIEELLDPKPFFTNCPETLLSFSHCVLATFDLNASDTGLNAGIAGYALIPPSPGNISGTGVWSWGTALADVGLHTICAEVTDLGGGKDTCCFDVEITNVAPTCSFPNDTPLVAIGNSIQIQGTGVAHDCDPIAWFEGTATPTPDGTWDVDNNGLFTFNSAVTDEGVYCFTVGVTDGVDTSFCEVCVEVVSVLKWDVVIENKTNAGLGQFTDVCVWVEQGTERLGGFDILIAYDASVLIFQKAFEGSIYAACDWEYFTYRFGPFGNCGNACPSGLLRVIGMAEINNGPVHPDCFGNPPAVPFSLFCMTFYVTSLQIYECQQVPLRFYWFDCGDNTLSSKDGDTLWVSKEVFEKGGGPQNPGEEHLWSWADRPYTYIDITDMYSGFPTYTGVQADSCLVDPDGQGPKKPPQQFINFFDGGVDIVCIDTLDDRGDINLNGVPNEIADAVMFTNYFIYGLSIFHINQAAQIAATDVNNDGLTLSVADLVYLIRVITGDAQPYPKLSPVVANFTNDAGVLSIDAEMGAASVVIQGNVSPELLVGQMEMKYAYDAEANVTRVIVYSMAGNGFTGEFLSANGNVVSIELGSYEGAVVKLNNIPAEFALHQNYPNPFNPTTTVSFSLPVASDYTLSIYNVAGQQVASFSDRADAGVVEINWDASTMASGVYFYKLVAGNFSDTKKMVLLK
jgi:hypothetical protein